MCSPGRAAPVPTLRATSAASKPCGWDEDAEPEGTCLSGSAPTGRWAHATRQVILPFVVFPLAFLDTTEFQQHVESSSQPRSRGNRGGKMLSSCPNHFQPFRPCIHILYGSISLFSCMRVPHSHRLLKRSRHAFPVTYTALPSPNGLIVRPSPEDRIG